MTIDVDAARADTPGCRRFVHFNNAGAALPPQPVVDTVIAHLRLEADTGGYEAALAAEERLDAVYDEIAGLLGAEPGEIALTDSATRAWDAAFAALRFAPGDRILTHRVEYASNFLPMLAAARRDGASIELVPSTRTGEVDAAALDGMLDDHVRVVALTHVPSQSGLVNPAEDVGRRTRRAGIPFFLDACQSAGQLPIDVEALGCDVLAATGRKFLRAPRGTGFLYIRLSMLDRFEPPFPDLRGAQWVAPDRYVVRADARRFELWERSVANVLGLGAAVAYARRLGLDAIWARVAALAAGLRTGLAAVPGVTVRDEGRRQGAIVTFTLDSVAADAVVSQLRAGGINTWAIDASTARLDLGARDVPAVVRASAHYYNTDDEVDRTIAAVAQLAH